MKGNQQRRLSHTEPQLQPRGFSSGQRKGDRKQEPGPTLPALPILRIRRSLRKQTEEILKGSSLLEIGQNWKWLNPRNQSLAEVQTIKRKTWRMTTTEKIGGEAQALKRLSVAMMGIALLYHALLPQWPYDSSMTRLGADAVTNSSSLYQLYPTKLNWKCI